LRALQEHHARAAPAHAGMAAVRELARQPRGPILSSHNPKEQRVSVAVVHSAARRRFELDVDGQTVFTEYRLSPGVMTLFHTLTPPALRGRGLAARVVRAALEFARAEGLKVNPLCWYVNEHIKAHPEFRQLLAPQSS
jgi:predicted GNAT family acetyltransferase